MKTKIIGTGITGLVGSRIVELLHDKYDFESISYESGIDITNRDQVEKIFNDSPARVVLHLAAKADVDGCEKDREIDTKILRYEDTKKRFEAWQKEKTAWWINVEGTRNIVEACQKTGKKIIYISTDFVFDGRNAPAEGYTEEDKPHPINWYAVTKYEGEKIITNASLQDKQLPYLICRIAFPYRAKFDLKKDLIRAIMEKLKNGEKLVMVSDQIITPTFIDDIALAIDKLIAKKAEGIFHVSGSSFHSPKEIASIIAKTFNLNQSLIEETTREDYYKDRAPRPFSLVLKNDKLRSLGIKMSTLEEGLEKVKEQRKL